MGIGLLFRAGTLESVQAVSKPIAEDPNGAPGYWRTRLFRNSYTRGGQRREVQGWRVKIQDAGPADLPPEVIGAEAAAREAVALFRSLGRARGGGGFERCRKWSGGQPGTGCHSPGRPGIQRLRVGPVAVRPGFRKWCLVSLAGQGESGWAGGAGSPFPLGNGGYRGGGNAVPGVCNSSWRRRGWNCSPGVIPKEATVAIRWCADPSCGVTFPCTRRRESR